MQLIAIDRDQPQLSYPTTGALVISATTTGPFAVLLVGNHAEISGLCELSGGCRFFQALRRSAVRLSSAKITSAVLFHVMSTMVGSSALGQLNTLNISPAGNRDS